MPWRQLGLLAVELELLAHERVEAFLVERERNEVDVVEVLVSDDSPRVDVCEERDLLAQVGGDRDRSSGRPRCPGGFPIRRSSFTECCVGFVLSSPATSMNGIRVTWTYSTLAFPHLTS